MFAVPGNADSSKSMGANSLLKQGARLTLSAEDILAELGFSVSRKIKPGKRISLTAEEEKFILFLEEGPVHLDELTELSGFSLQKAVTVLSYLQIKGAVKETPGKYFQKS